MNHQKKVEDSGLKGRMRTVGVKPTFIVVNPPKTNARTNPV